MCFFLANSVDATIAAFLATFNAVIVDLAAITQMLLKKKVRVCARAVRVCMRVCQLCAARSAIIS